MSMAATSSTYETIVPRADRSPERSSHQIVVRAGAVAAAAALVLGGYWSISAMAGADPKPVSKKWISVPGGELRVESTRRIAPTKGTRGDFKRFELDVTVSAGEKAMVVNASSFRIDGYLVYLGMEPVASQPNVKRIRPGREQAFTLTYQVTRDADSFSLIFEGSDDPIPFRVGKD
jgi:hypothetical protein